MEVLATRMSSMETALDDIPVLYNTPPKVFFLLFGISVHCIRRRKRLREKEESSSSAEEDSSSSSEEEKEELEEDSTNQERVGDIRDMLESFDILSNFYQRHDVAEKFIEKFRALPMNRWKDRRVWRQFALATKTNQKRHIIRFCMLFVHNLTGRG